MELLFILFFIFTPLVMVLIGIAQFAKAAETIKELRDNKHRP